MAKAKERSVPDLENPTKRWEIGELVEIVGIIIQVTSTHAHETRRPLATVHIQGASLELFLKKLLLRRFTDGYFATTDVRTDRQLGIAACPDKDEQGRAKDIDLILDIGQDDIVCTPMCEIAEETGVTTIYEVTVVEIDEQGITVTLKKCSIPDAKPTPP